MKLYQVEYLLEVCAQGSFSKAADALLISRPAISRAMKDLEDEYGVTLFQRTTTGVVPTEAGEIILEYVQKYYRQFAFPACKEVIFTLATLGNDAGIYGAAKEVL